MNEKEWEEFTNHENFKPPKAYREHRIFNELDKYIGFYDLLSYCVVSWVSPGVNKVLNFDCHIFSSMKSTIKSIKLLLEHGKINDAYSLARKYQDLTVLNIYALAYIDENFDYEDSDIENINDWIEDKAKLPDYRKMNDYIATSKKISSIREKIQVDHSYTSMRKRLNDHMHYNYYTYMRYNDEEQMDFSNIRIQFLDQLCLDIQSVFINHFILLFTIKDNYMASSEYVDYLDMGQEPPHNSQYWVASFVQEIFDGVIKKNRPDLVEEFKKHICMELK